MRLGPDAFRRLCAARQLLQEERDEPLTVAEVARRLTLSPFHFIRQFDVLFGATPNRFRRDRRVERAKELLIEGRSVTETCMAVGFSSVGSFSALFKREVGVAPSEYQRHACAARPARAEGQPQPVPGCLGLMSRLAPDAFRNSREA
jgi:AraC-like DNA-binding protein